MRSRFRTDTSSISPRSMRPTSEPDMPIAAPTSSRLRPAPMRISRSSAPPSIRSWRLCRSARARRFSRVVMRPVCRPTLSRPLSERRGTSNMHPMPDTTSEHVGGAVRQGSESTSGVVRCVRCSIGRAKAGTWCPFVVRGMGCMGARRARGIPPGVRPMRATTNQLRRRRGGQGSESTSGDARCAGCTGGRRKARNAALLRRTTHGVHRDPAAGADHARRKRNEAAGRAQRLRSATSPARGRACVPRRTRRPWTGSSRPGRRGRSGR